MSIVTRPNSPYYWANLPGRRRLSLKIPIDGATPAQRRENKQLAEAAYSVLLGDLARHRFRIPKVGELQTFAKYAAWYDEHHTEHHEGKVQERRILARLMKAFGPLTLDQIRPPKWQEYAGRRLKQGRAKSTVGRELAVMKAILSTAVGEQLEYHPLATVKRTSAKLNPKRTITRRDEPTFLKALKSIDPEIADMYVVGVGTLLRRDNLLTLRRSQYRPDRLSVHTKTGPHAVPLTRPTPLQRRAAKTLRARLPSDPDGLFFPLWAKRFASYADVGHPSVLFLKKVRRAAKAAGLPWGLKNDGIVWHTATRASGATRMLREHKIDVRTVQVIGGWSSLDQMAAYLGIDRADLFAAT